MTELERFVGLRRGKNAEEKNTEDIRTEISARMNLLSVPFSSTLYFVLTYISCWFAWEDLALFSGLLLSVWPFQTKKALSKQSHMLR